MNVNFETLRAKIDLYYMLLCPTWMKPGVDEAKALLRLR